MSANLIKVDVRYPKPKDALAGATLYPGFLLEKSAGNMIAHATAGGNAVWVADMLMEESIADTYASTEYIPYFPIQRGDIFNAYLTTSQTITEGEAITSNGDGYVKTASDGAEALGSATNYVTFTPAFGQMVTVAFVDPSGTSQSLAVTITGSHISVSLATDGSDVISSIPSEIVMAVEAVTGYDSLVSVAATGTGVVTADTAILDADEVFAIADEAVSTTSALDTIKATVARNQ